MKRVPSFSTRPGFPLGLRVLVVDESPDEVESMLTNCGFCPIISRSAKDALRKITDQQVDVLLVDAQCISKKTPENTALLSWAKTHPLVLMATGRAEMVCGITKQGAVEVMEKPLHQAKVKNIWQHVVRKMMVVKPVAAGKGQSSRLEDSAPNDTSSGEGSGGSQLSTHGMQADMELDLETSSLHDITDAGLGSSTLSGLAHGFSHLLTVEQSAMTSSCSAGSSGTNFKMGSFPSQVRASRSSAEIRRVQNISQQHSIKPSAPPSVVRPSSAPPGQVSMVGQLPPTIGHSCGQLPQLSSDGMVWGLPTTPLQIAPKPGLVPPWLMPPSPMMMPMPGMFGFPPPGPGAGMMMMPHVPSPAQQPAFMRADSAPLAGTAFRETLPPSMVHSLSFMMSCGGSAEIGITATPSSPCSSDLQLDFEGDDRPPIGLRLKKSASFMDMINRQLVGV